jgi:hypothetical protein
MWIRSMAWRRSSRQQHAACSNAQGAGGGGADREVNRRGAGPEQGMGRAGFTYASLML